MTDAEKFKHISEYVRRRYMQESIAWTDADEKGEVMSAAKASIREEILFEIINELNKIEKSRLMFAASVGRRKNMGKFPPLL